ncbi:MAG: hypothetical protein J0M02_19840, partial [Planctomycetes bacterium]|nr:hypothetical protein [Planctomycetota bacterium]
SETLSVVWVRNASLSPVVKGSASTSSGVSTSEMLCGASPIVPPELLAAFQAQQRLDARAAGAGKE